MVKIVIWHSDQKITFRKICLILKNSNFLYPWLKMSYKISKSLTVCLLKSKNVLDLITAQWNSTIVTILICKSTCISYFYLWTWYWKNQAIWVAIRKIFLMGCTLKVWKKIRLDLHNKEGFEKWNKNEIQNLKGSHSKNAYFIYPSPILISPFQKENLWNFHQNSFTETSNPSQYLLEKYDHYCKCKLMTLHWLMVLLLIFSLEKLWKFDNLFLTELSRIF